MKALSLAALLMSGASVCCAQVAMGAIAGMVKDPSGALVPNAGIHLRAASGTMQDAASDATGRFTVSVAAGAYDAVIHAPGFRDFERKVTVVAGATAHLDAKLAIETRNEEVAVPMDSGVSTSSADNASALVFHEQDLQQFSADDATFQREVQALAGSAGPRPPDILINGFSGGKFPPKSSIREIRINSNPYSAEFQDLGYGRFEVFTKPGKDKLHGGLTVNATDSAFNGQNPYIPGAEPPYYLLNLDGNLNGPLDKKTSFYLAGTVNDQQNNAAVNAFTGLDGNGNPVPFAAAVRDPQLTNTYSLRVDRQVTPTNTLTSRYEFSQVNLTNGGLTAALTLPSQAFNIGTTNQTLQFSDTQSIGSNTVEETRFQYMRTRLNQGPASGAPTLLVEGGFNGGGSALQQQIDNQDHYEFQEYFSRQQGKQFLRIGGKYRLVRDSNVSTANYNGQYTFGSLAAYAAGTPSQYTQTTGLAHATVQTGDLALFFDDEWKVKKHFTLDLGMRYETQSGIPDHNDPAPRVGANWAIYRKKQPRIPFIVLRGGAGIFYDRFAAANILTAIRQNGVSQQTYVVTPLNYNPSGPPVGQSLTATPPTIYRINPKLRSQYRLAEGVTVEKNNKLGHFSANYIYIRGARQWGSENINAPLPGTYNPAVPTSGVRPLGGSQNIYEFESEGISKTQVVFFNSRVHLGKRVVAFLSYSITHGQQDVSNASGFASNSYNLSQDYGRAVQPTQQLFAGGTVQLPFKIAGNIFVSTQGGTPFNITTGTDLNGDTIYNDRPAFATAPTANSVIYRTKYGTFDANPQPGERIVPVNYGNSPNFLYVDPSLTRELHFGPRPAAPASAAGKPGSKRPEAPYTISFTVDAPNVLNHRNPGVPVGVLGSPEFGQSLNINPVFSPNTASNRVIFLQTSINFYVKPLTRWVLRKKMSLRDTGSSEASSKLKHRRLIFSLVN